MTMNRAPLEHRIRELFQQQLLGVLATNTGAAGAEPYVSLIAFAASADLRRLFFYTSRSTRKFTNMVDNSRVSMLIDNRSNQAGDFQTALAVTVLGRAMEQQGPQKITLQQLFLARHPELESFALDPSSALMEILVDRYILVSSFQQVQDLVMDTTVAALPGEIPEP
jgi:heme iron utilization protein